MKRFALTVLMLSSLVLGLTSTVAEAATGVPVVQRTHVEFDLTSATCSRLPAGTKIHGEGPEISITTDTTDRHGIRTIRNATNASGRATDERGNSYTFQYANQFHITNSLAQPDRFSGQMSDVFVLAGRGRANLHNGFVAGFTTNADLSNVFAWRVRFQFGDPISFDPGPFDAHCDPL